VQNLNISHFQQADYKEDEVPVDSEGRQEDAFADDLKGRHPSFIGLVLQRVAWSIDMHSWLSIDDFMHVCLL
jgi:hypothetical protein